MNMIKKILGITFMLFACIGCKNADMYQDVVFFTGTENNQYDKGFCRR